LKRQVNENKVALNTMVERDLLNLFVLFLSSGQERNRETKVCGGKYRFS
jgi:hypothetical protein